MRDTSKADEVRCGEKSRSSQPVGGPIAPPWPPPATVYFGPVEIRAYKQTAEQVITYQHPSVKLTNGRALANAQFLHRDHLASVRAITGSTGAVVERSVYKPYGEQTEWLSASQPAPETKGWIGERFDAGAGLQYLNARYYDPVLGMFLQPDWWEVRIEGVGTNRFAYSGNDPVNLSDPSGNKPNKDKTMEKEASSRKSMAEQKIATSQHSRFDNKNVTMSIIKGDWRTENGKITGKGQNPFGHVAVGLTGIGILSEGTRTPIGSSIRDYVIGQSAHRSQSVIQIDVTGRQAQAYVDSILSARQARGEVKANFVDKADSICKCNG
jgi:RHS repeat-associated protein